MFAPDQLRVIKRIAFNIVCYTSRQTIPVEIEARANEGWKLGTIPYFSIRAGLETHAETLKMY